MKTKYEVWDSFHQLKTVGTADQVKEWMEEELAKHLGFFVMLQENTDDDSFMVYLHTDNADMLDEEELEVLADNGLAIHEIEMTWKNIKRLLEGISVIPIYF